MAYRKKSDRGRSLQVYAGGSKSAQPSEGVQPPTTPSTSPNRKAVVRVAIYCRKSSEEGLEQQFNSLDAQRASGEAYVQSRAMDGWVCIGERFEDCGISGGTLDRPALQRLLMLCEARQVDVLLVYKLDRLTRSIRDFGKIMDVLDRNRVQLACVSQSISTTDSSGRLMVNVLLSFAQFERELASDRTKNKIALSRQRGMWMGGRPILGYDASHGVLSINPAEAAVVREIFDRVLRGESFRKILAWLLAEGHTTKQWLSSKGQVMGGAVFTLGRLSELLSNPLYVGLVPHHDKLFDGVHQPIIDKQVYERVQELLRAKARTGGSGQHPVPLLRGVIRCARCDKPLVHAFTETAIGRVHRYYRCLNGPLIGSRECKRVSLPAVDLERIVTGQLKAKVATPRMRALALEACEAEDRQLIATLEARRSVATSEVRSNGKSNGSDRVKKLDGEIEAARQRLQQRGRMAAGLKDFEAIWGTLNDRERNALVQCVFQVIRYDKRREELDVVAHEDVIATGTTHKGAA
jgi:site-specific DNA recombinase